MLYRKIKGTDVEASAIALGTAQFGAAYPEALALRELDVFIERGGNMIDTAHVYSDWIPGERSRSEKLIGRWLRESGMREKAVLITKGAHPSFDDFGRSRVRRGDIRRDIEEGLENLRTGRVDFFLLHRDDPSVPAGEIVGWMNELIREGLARYWGVSNWTARRIAEANAFADARGLEGIRMNQTMWSFAVIDRSALADRTLVPMDGEMYQYHAATGLSLTAYTSQAKGYFPRLAAGERLPADVEAVYGSGENDRRMAFLKRVSEETGLGIAEFTMLYFTKQPFAAIPVAAFGSVTRLEATLAAFTDEAAALIREVDFP